MVEQEALNFEVLGSSPRRWTRIILRELEQGTSARLLPGRLQAPNLRGGPNILPYLNWQRTRLLSDEVAGSRPVGRTTSYGGVAQTGQECLAFTQVVAVAQAAAPTIFLKTKEEAAML